MTPERWRQIEQVFHAASACPPLGRDAYLAESCRDDPDLRAEVESLLTLESNAESQLAGAVATAAKSVQSASTAGRRVGPYTLVREIGHGGMGDVYQAVRSDGEFQQAVAIKLIRRGMDSEFVETRFRHERQILARLDHPHIARLLDGGSTADGQPYFVMEYIDGLPIHRYADENRLPLDERLRLFLGVCDAVQYAHQSLVVHRDLKPPNILVTKDGAPKLLDFGIAKLLDPDLASETVPETSTGLRLLTPDYASPEQVRGDVITTATDVYSLGCILYELLTGEKAHRLETHSPAEIARVVCETDPERPSRTEEKGVRWRRQLEGDLDTIVLTTLRKEPQRRYGSAEQLAADIRRYLDYRPIAARPDTLRYRASKFARRNRVGIAAAAIVMVTMSAATAVSLAQARIARERFDQARKLANNVLFDIHDAVRDLPGSTPARKKIVETAVAYLDTLARGARDDSGLRQELAAAYRRIGEVQGNVMGSNLGDTRAALDSFGKALALLDQDGGSAPELAVNLERMTLHLRIGNIYNYTRDGRHALETFQRGARLGEAASPLQDAGPDFSRCLAELHLGAARVQHTGGDFAASAESASRARDLIESASRTYPADRSLQLLSADASSQLGMTQTRLNRTADALGNYRRAAGIFEDILRVEPNSVRHRRGLMMAHGHVGDLLGNPTLESLGDTAGAAEAYRKMVDLARKLHEADPADLRSLGDYGIALMRLAQVMSAERPREALPLYTQSHDLLTRALRVDPRNRVVGENMSFVDFQIGDLLVAAGNSEGAARHYRACRDRNEALLRVRPSGPLTTILVRADGRLGEIAARRGSRVEALRRVSQAVDFAGKQAGGKSGTASPHAFRSMGVVYAILSSSAGSTPEQRRLDREQSVQWHEKSLAAWRQLESESGFALTSRREIEITRATLAPLRGKSEDGSR